MIFCRVLDNAFSVLKSARARYHNESLGALQVIAKNALSMVSGSRPDNN